MKRSEIQEIARANIEHLRDQLRLWDWHIDIYYERIEGDAAATVKVRSDYHRADISLDPERLDTEEEVLQALRHELIHIFLWPFHAFGEWAQQKSPGGEMASEDYRVFTHHLERSVWFMERFMSMHNFPLKSELLQVSQSYWRDGASKPEKDEVNPENEYREDLPVLSRKDEL